MRSFVISRKRIAFIFYGLIILLGLLFIIGTIRSTCIIVSAKNRKLPIYGVETEEKKIAISFDCAWENSDTDILLDILERYQVKSTFFATGDFCERYPEDIKKMAGAGHSIQNHSNKHPHVENIEKEKLIEDTTACDEIIQSLTGKRPTLYRAPYGEYSNQMLSVFETDLPHKVIQWDCDSVDWKKPTSEVIIQRISKKVRNGSILLFHNDTQPTPPALEVLIPKLQSEGYQFVLIEDLIYYDNYTLNHEGRQVRQAS